MRTNSSTHPIMAGPVRIAIVALLAFMAAPTGGRAQNIAELFGAIRQGGGWVTLPIQSGHGTLQTAAFPSVGLSLKGCLQVWGGHSGRWQIRVNDRYGNGSLEADAEAGEHVLFTYAPGPWGQLDIDVRWSEPRDTTLLVWVGLEGGARQRDPCEPVYANGGGKAPTLPTSPAAVSRERAYPPTR